MVLDLRIVRERYPEDQHEKRANVCEDTTAVRRHLLLTSILLCFEAHHAIDVALEASLKELNSSLHLLTLGLVAAVFLV